jgi:8-oxo-dGTP diphosphatase
MSGETSQATVRAVCGLVATDDQGRVLLIRRSDDGSWGLPGGGVEVGESWEQAAVRECQEETGWQVDVDGLLGVYSEPRTQVHRYPDGRQVHFFGVVFTGTVRRRSTVPDGEATEVGFFALDRLPRRLFAPDEPVLEEAVRRRLGPYLR